MDPLHTHHMSLVCCEDNLIDPVRDAAPLVPSAAEEAPRECGWPICQDCGDNVSVVRTGHCFTCEACGWSVCTR